MKLKDIHSQELLPEFASDVVFAAEAFDKMMRYAAMRVDSLPAPLTLESALELTDEEQAAYFEQYGLAKYYPDISHDKRSWMLWMQNKLWRYLGTPNSIETLCSYLFDDIPVRLKIYDNFAFDAQGHLIDEALLDVFDAELTIERPALPSGMLERVKANIIRFVRNQEWMRAFIFLFEAMDITMGVSLTDGERYARDYLINLEVDDILPIEIRLGTSNNLGVSRDFSIVPAVMQYGFVLDFEIWSPSSTYITEYNIVEGGFTISARGMVIGQESSPIRGSKSFMLNTASQFNNYITISGLHGIGGFAIKAAPHPMTFRKQAVIEVSDGTTIHRLTINPGDPVRTFSFEFSNPSAQQITIRPVQTSYEERLRVRIDDIEI
ncbi:MAG: hypothetical protein ACOCN0_01670 [Prevotella sp.]